MTVYSAGPQLTALQGSQFGTRNKLMLGAHALDAFAGNRTRYPDSDAASRFPHEEPSPPGSTLKAKMIQKVVRAGTLAR